MPERPLEISLYLCAQYSHLSLSLLLLSGTLDDGRMPCSFICSWISTMHHMSLTNIILITIFSGILIYNLWPETVAPKSNNRVRLPDLDLPTHNDPEFMRRFWRPYLNVKSQLLPISNDMDLAQSSKMLLYHTFADMSIMLWGHLLNPELNVAKSEEIPEENGEIIYSKTLAALI